MSSKGEEEPIEMISRG
jgi:hypothetical protein